MSRQQSLSQHQDVTNQGTALMRSASTPGPGQSGADIGFAGSWSRGKAQLWGQRAIESKIARENHASFQWWWVVRNAGQGPIVRWPSQGEYYAICLGPDVGRRHELTEPQPIKLL